MCAARADWAAQQATVASAASGNATKSPSPSDFTSTPPWAAKHERRIWSWSSRTSWNAAVPSAVSMGVDASMSVNTKVTRPDGSRGTYAS